MNLWQKHFVLFLGVIMFSLVASAAEKTITGKISSVDADKNSITLEGVDLDVTRKTKITVEGKKATLTDIEKGQQATVAYDDGLEVATSISVANESEKGDEAIAKNALQGEWIFVEGVAAGKPIANQDSTRRIVIKGDSYTLFAGDRAVEGTLEFYDTKSPKHLNFIPEKGGSPEFANKVQRGICEITNDGNTLRFCVGTPDGKRPTKFDGTPQGWSIQTYKKQASQAKAGEPLKVIHIPELKIPANTSSLYFSPDGLSVYWDGVNGEIWTARRKTAADRFREAKSTEISGRHPTISEDELELIYIAKREDGKQGESLHTAKRESKSDDFQRPVEIAELLDASGNSIKCPVLTANRLKLYYFVQDGKNTVLESTRLTTTDRWRPPVPLQIQRDDKVRFTWFDLSRDELSMLTAATATGQESHLIGWKRSSVTEPFITKGVISMPSGEKIAGRSPRYIEATKELFWVNYVGDVPRISCITNFESLVPFWSNGETGAK